MHDVEELKPEECPIETISELVADGGLFDSQGFTVVKVTKPGFECISCGEKFAESPEICTGETLKLKNGKMDEAAHYKICDSVKFQGCNISKSIRLPIKSTGVAEFQEKLSGKAPKPPKTFESIKKDSKEGRAMGLKHSEMHIVFDDTDDAYIDAQEKHTQDFLWQIAIFALDLKWKKSDGTEAQSFDEKKEILKSNNITGHHIDKIYNDVILLTQFEEDRKDFLSKNS